MAPLQSPLAGAPATCNGLGIGAAAKTYAVVADPLDTSGQYPSCFGSNSDGTIYEDSSTLSLTVPESGRPPSGDPIR